MSNLTRGEEIVLGQHLSAYDPDLSFEDNLELLKEGELSVWEPFESWDGDIFIEHIIQLAKAIDNYKR